MPNIDNINAPITLISFGRSGTSLLGALLERHSEVDFVGETAQVVFFSWLGGEMSRGVIPHDEDDHTWERKAADIVRGAFLGAFPTTGRRWMQKPIGIPEAFWYLHAMNAQEKAAWYWKALSSSFPEARCFTMLRNPIDVAVSAVLYWGFDAEDILRQLSEMASLLIHPSSKIEFAINYHDLIRDPEANIRALCSRLDLAFEFDMLEAMKEPHARHSASPAQVSAALDAVVSSQNFETTLATVEETWRRFGFEPSNFQDSCSYRVVREELGLMVDGRAAVSASVEVDEHGFLRGDDEPSHDEGAPTGEPPFQQAAEIAADAGEHCVGDVCVSAFDEVAA